MATSPGPLGLPLARLAATLGLAATLAGAPALGAQARDSLRAADSTRVAADSVPFLTRLGPEVIDAEPPLSPRRAFLYSFLVPGLAQARLDRPTGGTLFAVVELGAIAMAVKSLDDLRYARRAARVPVIPGWTIDTAGVAVPTDSLPNRYTDRIRPRRVHYEDWIAVLVFNHLFAGADAFVAAQLWDMPVRGSVRALGPREAFVGARVEFGGRRPR